MTARSVGDAGWFGLTQPLRFGSPHLDAAAIISMCIVILVTYTAASSGIEYRSSVRVLFELFDGDRYIALTEELVYDGGSLLNPNVVEYQVPRIGDLPREVVQMVVERRDGVGPYGSKGAGEGSLNPMSAAVGAAVARAVGAAAREVPLTPERVWRLILGRTTSGEE